MYLIRVTDHDLASEFINLPSRLNHQYKPWSKSQQKHVKALIKRKAVFFQTGEAEFWIITNFRGETIGRIAAFVDHSVTTSENRGYIGLFDCINHFKAASILFDACKGWFKQFSIDVMEGPVNLLPFQIEGVALEAGFQQATAFFSSQTTYLADLYEFYGFKVCSTQKMLRIKSISSLYSQHLDAETASLFTNADYEFLQVKKADLKVSAESIHSLYRAVRDLSMPAPSVEDILQWLHLLFDQHFPPLIYIVRHQKLPIAFIANTFISSKPGEAQNETVFQQLISRFSSKNKSLLNLAWCVHPDYQSQQLHSALLNTLDETLTQLSSLSYDSFLMMNTGLDHVSHEITPHEIVDTFVKFEYQFDQETLIDTFAKSKSLSRN